MMELSGLVTAAGAADVGEGTCPCGCDRPGVARRDEPEVEGWPVARPVSGTLTATAAEPAPALFAAVLVP